jgi:hypothetical protein
MRLSQPYGFHMASDFAAGISCNVRRGPDLPPMDVRLSAGAAAGVCAPRLRGGPPIMARSPAGQPPWALSRERSRLFSSVYKPVRKKCHP